jgi:hypothetical protein
MEIERLATRGHQERPTTRWKREDRPMTRESANVLDTHSEMNVLRNRGEDRPVSRRGMSRQVNMTSISTSERKFSK